MTQTSAWHDSLDESTDAQQLEGLWSVALRRARYVLAIIVCGFIYWYLAWPLVAPPADYTGLSILAWPQVNTWAAGFGMVGLVILCTIISILITHPDAPHTGMFCALLAMGVLTLRGGSMHMLLEHAERDGAGAGLYYLLAWECLIWLGVAIVAEITTRVMVSRFFRQSQWLIRQGLEEPQLRRVAPAPWMVAREDAPRRDSLAWLGDAGAFGITLGLGTILLVITLQSPAKWQVIFGCFVSFFLAAMAANGVFPRAQIAAIWLAVPVAAAIGYLRAATHYVSPALGLPEVFPGHATVSLARAMPIDYLLAGIPGAIAGVHTAIGLRVHNLLASEAAEE